MVLIFFQIIYYLASTNFEVHTFLCSSYVMYLKCTVGVFLMLLLYSGELVIQSTVLLHLLLHH